VHAAEGRTVDTCHALAGEGLSRALLYVAITRGRDANHVYVITDPATADLRPGSRPGSTVPAPDHQPSFREQPSERSGGDQGRPWVPPADRISVLAAYLDNDGTDPSGAPPHIGDELRATAQARRDHAAQASRARARARSASPGQRAGQRAEAHAHQQLADSLELRELTLSDIDTQRASWYEATAQARESAREATEELRRRLPDTDLRSFHERDRSTQGTQPRTRQHDASAHKPEPGLSVR
jgi:hypothetical protein